jgi:hypothetical protein
LIREHGLDGLGSEMESRWTREDDRWSLRELADWFNKRLLEATLSEAGVRTVDGEVTNYYRLLTDDDDVNDADRVQVRRRLEGAGVDVEALRREFVTYQAIRSYLKDVREATYSEDTTTTPESVQQRIDRLAGRAERVASEQIGQLRTNGDIDLGEFRVFTDTQVYCQECNNQYDVEDLLENGGCACDR